MIRRAAAVLLALCAALAAAGGAAADDAVAYVAEVSGDVRLVRGAEARAAALGEALRRDDRLEVGADGAFEIVFSDGSTAEVDAGSRVRMGEILFRRFSLLLDRGALRATAVPNPGRRYEVTTPVATAGVRGTDFGVAYAEGDEAEVDVFEGEVEVSPPPSGRWTPERVRAGEQARARLRQAIQRRRMTDERRAAWEARRDRIVGALFERAREAIESGRATPADVYRHLPESVRTRLRGRFEDRIRRAREVRLRAGAALRERVENRREHFRERRENVRERRQERRR